METGRLSYSSSGSGAKTPEWIGELTFRSQLSKGKRDVTKMEDHADADAQRESEGGRTSGEEEKAGGRLK